MDSGRDIEKRRRHLRVGFHHLSVCGKAEARHDLLYDFAREIEVQACHHAMAVGKGRGGIEHRHGGGRNGTDARADAPAGTFDLIDAFGNVGAGEACARGRTESFPVNGASPGPNAALLSAGAEIRLASHVTVGAKFDSEFAQGSRSYAETGSV
jgi:hypothetical protein